MAYGSGLSLSGLSRMARFYDCLPDEHIVATRSQRLLFERTAISKQPDAVIRTELSQLAQLGQGAAGSPGSGGLTA